MPQHVGMNWKWKPRSLASTLDHPQEPRRCYWRASFGGEHTRTVALQWPQCSQFRSMQWMNTLNSAFSSVDMQSAIPQINLGPTQAAKLLRSQSMSICQEDSRCIPSTVVPTFACSLDQSINLFLGQILHIYGGSLT